HLCHLPSSPTRRSSDLPPPVPERLVITLRAEPAHAILYLDDGPALPNPYQASVSRDERPHVLRARAPGYLEQSKELRFDQSKEVDRKSTRLNSSHVKIS